MQVWPKSSPYDYIVGVRNIFKGLDLTESLMNYGWRFMTLYRRQASRPSPRKRIANMQNGWLRRPYQDGKQVLRQWERWGSERVRQWEGVEEEKGLPERMKNCMISPHVHKQQALKSREMCTIGAWAQSSDARKSLITRNRLGGCCEKLNKLRDESVLHKL